MSLSPHLPVAHIALDRIRKNYRHLERLSSADRQGSGQSAPPALLPGYGERSGDIPFAWPPLMPVIKADAYGHGHIRVAEALLAEGAKLFASGAVQEAVQLRKGLAASSPAGPAILSLLGLVRREDVCLCAEYGIIPLVHSLEHLSLLEGTERSLAVAVKCDTGMSRLGFNEDELPAFIAGLKKLPAVRPVIALTHLHSADAEQGCANVRSQSAAFARMLRILRATWPDLAASLANSAGTFLTREITEAIGPHVCRPGVALYGSNPFAGTSLEPLGAGLLPAMAVSAPIIAVRTLRGGAGIGYGHTHIAARDSAVGIVATGYADGFTRSLSNKGVMCVAGVRAPIIGRVAMQMTSLDLSALPAGKEQARPAIAWIMGGPHPDAVSAGELAQLWGTITYEVLCLLGSNKREYARYPGE